MAHQDEGAAVPANQKSSWSSFLKSIASASGDLSSMTAPSFILSPTSLAEFPSYWGEPCGKFADIAGGKTPEERVQLVLRWYISTLSGQFTRRETQTGSEKKPFNPILGEQFLGSWEDVDGSGETKLWAEQVSHHPPVTAYFLQNESKKLSYQGHCAQKTSFSGKSIIVKQVGHAILRLTLPDNTVESYLITLPRLRIEGLWYGSPYVELDGTSYIQGSTGWHVNVEYKGKGYFSGKSHTFTAKISSHPKASSNYTIEGQWNGTSKYLSGTPPPSIPATFTSPEKYPEITVKPLEQQGEYESRRVWKDVSEGIRKGDFEGASLAKGKLENEQRLKRKEEVAAGTPWEMRYFKRVEQDEEYTKLAQQFGFQPATEEGFYFTEERKEAPASAPPAAAAAATESSAKPQVDGAVPK